MRQLRIAIVAGFSIFFALSFCAQANEVGVGADTILFGQAAALEGPSSALGKGMRQGILAAFAEINTRGGIYGRKLSLVSRDDGYDPDRSVAQTKKLIEEDRVFALIGAVGTPTSIATVPIASALNVPFIGPFTGAEFLRAPELRNVVNIRASYSAEAEAWIKHLTEDLNLKSVAIFYQDDAFGRDGLAGVKRALARRGLELTAEGTFERNTRAVAAALRVIKRAEPEAVVMVGTYGPCAEFIKLAHKQGFDPTFVNISFVGANALARELGADGNGVIVSQVVPFPWNTSLKVVADYQAAEKALDRELTPDFVSLEGYLSGRLAAAALELAGPNPTRAELLRIINEARGFDISGYVIMLGARMQDAPARVFLTVIQGDGTFKPVETLVAPVRFTAPSLPSSSDAADPPPAAATSRILQSPRGRRS